MTRILRSAENDVKGFVLAAGFGQRLAPLTQTVPKPLFPIGRLPLIGYALKLLAHHGITDVIVNLHHLAKHLRDALGDGTAYGVKITYSEEQEILGTGGGLKKMHAALDDTFIVVNSDILIDIDLDAVLAAHRQGNALATMILRTDPQQKEYGQIEIDPAGRLRRILGHVSPTDASSIAAVAPTLTPYMFTGVHVIEPRLLEYIPEGIETSVIHSGYVKALNNDEVLHGFVSHDYWIDAGTPARYWDANLDALTGKASVRYVEMLPPQRSPGVCVSPSAQVSRAAQLVAPVAIADDVHVGDGAVIGPNVVLARGVHVGRGAKVDTSVALDDVRIDSGATVSRSIVGKKAAIAIDSVTKGG